MVTAGPGVTNTVTAMANAALARIPVLLIGGCTSRPQANMGPLQDIPHVDILRPISRYSRTARVPEQVIREMDAAFARALGDLVEPGPSHIEIPTDVLRTTLLEPPVLDDRMRPRARRAMPPDPALIDQAAVALLAAKRPVVPHARFIRIADSAGELIDNRRGDPEILVTPALALEALTTAGTGRVLGLDREWADTIRAGHLKRSGPRELPERGQDGHIHPAHIFEVLREHMAFDTIAVADGGDLLSFARVGLTARTCLDAGAFGCLGVGVAYATAASLAFPGRQVIAVTGDGAYGLDVINSQDAVSSDARKGLGFVPDYQALTAWDEAERKRRGEA